MKRIAILAVGIATLTASGVEPVGVKVDLIAKPASAVTVPIESVTVSEADILRTAYDKVVTRQDLIAIVRGNGSEENRLRALNQIWDQDDVFLLFFKPGEDRNVAIRTAAIDRLAEIDVMKVLAKKSQIHEVCEVADLKLKNAFPGGRKEDIEEIPAVVGQYVQRLMGNLKKNPL